MKRLLAIVALLAIGLSPCIADAETVLKFANPDSPNSALIQRFWKPWAERVSKASDGEFRIEIMAGTVFSTLGNVYDRVTSNAADMGWALQDFIRGQFVLTTVGSLPFEVENAKEGSLALWKLFQSGIIADDYKEIKPLGLFVFPQSGIHTKAPIKTLEDLAGLKIRASGNISNKVVTNLGGASVAIPPHELYQSLNLGVVNGALAQWTAVGVFKLFEVTNYHLDGALGSSNAMVFMNKDSFTKLSEKAKKVISENTGERLSREFGVFLDDLNAEYRETVKAMPKHTLSTLGADEAKRWKDKVLPINKQWAEETPKGSQVLETYRQEVERIRSGK